MNTLFTTATIAAIVGSALIGGIFFAFSNFIMKALQRVSPAEGMRAMQAINVTVLNPGFLGIFMGTAVISVVLAVVAIAEWKTASSPYVLGGAAAYIGGTWLVTGMGNVPLNKQLEAAMPDATESSVVWEHYLEHWVKLNTQRTGAAVLAAVLFSIGLLYAQ